MSDIKGLFFEKQPISSKGLGAFSRKVLSDGIVQDCDFAYSGVNVTIQPGYLMICGRLCHLPAETTKTLDGITSGYARLIACADLSKEATKTSCEQAYFTVDYSSTEDGFSILTQGDINMDDSLYQTEFAILELSGGVINGVVMSMRQSMLNAYPVGAIFISAEDDSPAALFGGTWERLKDCFLLAAGDIYTVGDTGGEAEHTLTIDEMPNHRHYTTMVHTYSSNGDYGISYSGYHTAVYDKYTSYAGGDEAHNNMPPYRVVNVWQRIS